MDEIILTPEQAWEKIQAGEWTYQEFFDWVTLVEAEEFETGVRMTRDGMLA